MRRDEPGSGGGSTSKSRQQRENGQSGGASGCGEWRVGCLGCRTGTTKHGRGGGPRTTRAEPEERQDVTNAAK